MHWMRKALVAVILAIAIGPLVARISLLAPQTAFACGYTAIAHGTINTSDANITLWLNTCTNKIHTEIVNNNWNSYIEACVGGAGYVCSSSQYEFKPGGVVNSPETTYVSGFSWGDGYDNNNYGTTPTV